MTPLESFHLALASVPDGTRLRHLPVDWWDGPAGVWRPTVVEGAAVLTTGTRSMVDIAVPAGSVAEGGALVHLTRVVPIAQLRPSQLTSELVARFFSTRYSMEIVDNLRHRVARFSTDERLRLQDVMRELLAAYRESHDSWLEAYTSGARADSFWGRLFSDADAAVPTIEPDPTAAAAAGELLTELGDARIECSPVAWWDESSRRWRPVILIGSSSDRRRFAPASRVSILVPVPSPHLIIVSGADLDPLHDADCRFSLWATPVMARDLLRITDLLRAGGLTQEQVSGQPLMDKLARMIHGALCEWGQSFEAGLDNDPPPPRVVPLPPSLWGLSADSVTSADDANRR